MLPDCSFRIIDDNIEKGQASEQKDRHSAWPGHAPDADDAEAAHVTGPCHLFYRLKLKLVGRDPMSDQITTRQNWPGYDAQDISTHEGDVGHWPNGTR